MTQPTRARVRGSSRIFEVLYPVTKCAAVTNPADLRKTYLHATLDVADLTPDPLDLFRRWWHEAIDAGIDEPNAMTLATVGADGQPGARVVLLKGLHEDGFEFFTNYGSQKAAEMAANPRATLLFFWKETERQVRIEGLAEKVSRERTEEYFTSRPRGNQIGAWVSQQSQPIPDRSVLERAVEDVVARFEGIDPLPVPPAWGGYLVRPEVYEFWQGRADRLHDRFRYQRSAEGEWSTQRLSP